MFLNRTLGNVGLPEHGLSSFVTFQEVNDLVSSLHHECVKFMKSNLFKVTRSQGWKNLKITTQREVKEGEEGFYTSFRRQCVLYLHDVVARTKYFDQSRAQTTKVKSESSNHCPNPHFKYSR